MRPVREIRDMHALLWKISKGEVSTIQDPSNLETCLLLASLLGWVLNCNCGEPLVEIFDFVRLAEAQDKLLEADHALQFRQ